MRCEVGSPVASLGRQEIAIFAEEIAVPSGHRSPPSAIGCRRSSGLTPKPPRGRDFRQISRIRKEDVREFVGLERRGAFFAEDGRASDCAMLLRTPVMDVGSRRQ